MLSQIPEDSVSGSRRTVLPGDRTSREVSSATRFGSGRCSRRAALRRTFARGLRIFLSTTHVLDLAWTNSAEGFAKRVQQQEEIGDSIGPRRDDHHTEGQHAEVMLFFQFAIHRDEYVCDAASTLQQVAILDARPAEALDSRYVVIG